MHTAFRSLPADCVLRRGALPSFGRPILIRLGEVLEPEAQDLLRLFSGWVLAGGCGSGKEVKLLNDLGSDTHGMDFGPEAILATRQRCPELADPFVVEDMYNLDTVLGGEFDGIVANAVLVHLLDRDDLRPILKMMNSRLKPGGRLLLRVLDRENVPGAREVDRRLFDTLRWFVCYSVAETRERVQESGFSVARSQRLPYGQDFPDVYWVSAILTKGTA